MHKDAKTCGQVKKQRTSTLFGKCPLLFVLVADLITDTVSPIKTLAFDGTFYVVTSHDKEKAAVIRDRHVMV